MNEEYGAFVGPLLRRVGDVPPLLRRVGDVPYCSILGEFGTSREAPISFVNSVGPHGTTRLPLDGFSRNFVFEDSAEICRKNSSCKVQSDNSNGYLT